MATTREKQQIRWAIQELMQDAGDFTGAIGVLARIADLHYPAAEDQRGPGIPGTELGPSQGPDQGK